MTLCTQVEAIKEELRNTQAGLPDEAKGEQLLRTELNAVWMAIDAIAASIDEDKNALGF